ncbi:MAG: TrkH family potassium uptake protein [Clostridia bacterium]|nr:TrkH family potassium uptake protein [Clostridia bacterium]
MNVKYVCRITAYTVFMTALFMLAPAGIAFYDGETRNALVYLFVVGIMSVLGSVLFLVSRNFKPILYAQEGIAATSISWIVMSVFGALPFVLTGEIPRYIDALFEIVSGFSTTGASILSDVEALSRCNLFWRSFSHWMGGMGVLVFMLAVLPQTKKGEGSGIFLMKAESTGPSVSKFTPHLRQTAKILYILYIAFTIACAVFLLLGELPLFDSLCLALGTAGTGGFGILNDSAGSYSPYIQGVLAVFMMLFGINFSMYYLILLGQLKAVFKNEELRTYLGIILASVVLITVNIYSMYGSVRESMHHAFFQVSSIITTTGFSSVDFEQWPAFSKGILFILMFIGGCAGSTGGGMKVSRVLMLGKNIVRTISQTLHPRRMHLVKMDGHSVKESVANSVDAYLAVYCVIILFSFAIVSLDDYSLGTNFSAVVACFNNIGPGFELVGATGNYGHYSDLSKFVFIIDMLLGRLEIFPLLALFSPDLWSRKR